MPRGRPKGSKNKIKTQLTQPMQKSLELKPLFRHQEKEESYAYCRRNFSGFLETPKYCSKPIKTPNISNWCEDCRKILPIWPQ